MNYPLQGGRFFYGAGVLLFILFSLALLTTRHAYLAALPAFGLASLLVIFHRPAWGFYFVLLLIPFGEYRGFSGNFEFLTISKLVGFVVVIAVAISMVLKKGSWRFPRSAMWPWLALFFTAHLLSLLLSPYKATALDNVRQLITAYIMLTIPVLLFKEKDFRVHLPLVLLASVTVSSLLSIYGYVYKSPYFAMNVGSDAVTRAIGGSNSPNHFAALIIFCLPLAMYYTSHAATTRLRLLSAAAFGVNIVAVFLTFSRGGAIIAALTLTLMAITSLRRLRPSHMGFLLAGLLAGLLAAGLLVPESYWERQKSVTQTKTDPALSRRLTYLVVAADTFRDHPLFGIGPGAFREVYAETNYARQYAKNVPMLRRFAHNTYIEILIGTGIAGLLLFLGIVLQAYRDFRSADRSFAAAGDDRSRALIMAYRISLFSLLAYFFFLSNVYHKYFWVGLGLSVVAAALARQKALEVSHELDTADLQSP